MKKNNLLWIILIIAICVIGIVICIINKKNPMPRQNNEQNVNNDNQYEDYIKLDHFCDYVMETNVYTEVDQKYAYDSIANEYDKYVTGGGCTAVGKADTLDGMIIGRNMDLFITDKPSYVVKTDIPGFKRTFGLAYSSNKGESYEKVKEHGVEPNFYKLIPFLQTDVMNEDGFYIEINMRYADYDSEGNSIFSCSGTLPNQGKQRIMSFVLPQYLASRCSTVDEAVKMAQEELDIYTLAPNNGGIDWNFCFMMADATGKYGVLEIAKNKVVWNEANQKENNEMPDAACQANYYITPEFNAEEKMKSGVGRVDYIRKKWPNITCEENMYSSILGVTYFQTYFNYCQYNNFSEFIGEYEEDGEIFIGTKTPDIVDGETVIWDYDYVTNPANEKYVKAYINWIQDRISTRRADDTLVDIGAFWESTFTLVANATNKTMFVRFNENAKNIMFFKFADWKK